MQCVYMSECDNGRMKERMECGMIRLYEALTMICSMSLLAVINGEKAAYCTPTFSEKRERTLSMLLRGFEEEYNHEVDNTNIAQQSIITNEFYITTK